MPNLAPDALGKRLQDARNAKGLSRAALALASGVSPSTIVRAEIYGQIPTVKNLAALAGVLEVDLADLVNASQEAS